MTNITIDKLTFSCRIHGDSNNPAVIFLHGFPETSHMWIPLMENISKQGYFCIAPNMRGYSRNACPRGKKHYKVALIVNDVLAIADHFQKERFHLVGHDWGAVIGWSLTHNFKHRVISWSSLSVPHIQAFREAVKTSDDQKRRSRYIAWFRLPFISEYGIRKNDFALFRKLWKYSSPEEVDDYLSVFRNRKCLTGALNYYRENFGKGDYELIGNIETPTLFIWGNKDKAIGPDAVALGHNYCVGPYTFLEISAGHWLVQTAFDKVCKGIGEHLNSFNK